MTDGSSGALLSLFLDVLPVDGGSIAVISRSGVTSTIASSDAIAARLDAVQSDLGEGPRWSARGSAAPVIAADLSAARSRWPLFAATLADVPVSGVVAFPLLVGFHVVGVVDLYSRVAGVVWSDQMLVDGMQAANRTARPAVRIASRSAAAGRPTSGGAELRREVHQATGVVMVGLDLPPQEALARMEAYAFAVDRPLLDVARDLVERRLDTGALSG